MIIGQDTRIRVLFYILVALAAGTLRILFEGLTFPVHGILSIMYLTIYFEWMFSIRQRFWQKGMVRDLTMVAVMFAFWTVLRLIKYQFTTSGSDAERYLWYAYYIPFTLIPFFMHLASLNVRAPKKHRTPLVIKRLKYVPFLIILGVLTNDFHQKAFRFRDGIENWRGRYSYGPLYYLALAEMILCAAGVMTVVFKTCIKKQFLRYAYLPIVVILVGAFYFNNYRIHMFSGDKSLIERMYEMPEMICMLVIAFWESLVMTHLIPSNQNDVTLFRKSSIHGGLMDKKYQVQLAASHDIIPTGMQMKRSRTETIVMNHGDSLLKSCPVNGGYFYWMEDLTEINRLNRELEETGGYLEEEHTLLNESVELAESRSRTEQKNRLYDMIAQRLKPRLDMLESLIEGLGQEEAGFRRDMEAAAILQAYVKRYSNLLLLGDDRPFIGSGELALSIAESLDYVQLLGILGHSSIENGILLPASIVIFIYELFEEVLERALPDTTAVMVTMHKDREGVSFYMEVEQPVSCLPADWHKDEIEQNGDRLLVEYSDGVEYVTFLAVARGW